MVFFFSHSLADVFDGCLFFSFSTHRSIKHQIDAVVNITEASAREHNKFFFAIFRLMTIFNRTVFRYARDQIDFKKHYYYGFKMGK